MNKGKSILEQAFAKLSCVPRLAWLAILLASGVSAISDLVLWSAGVKVGWSWTAPLLALTAIWLWAVYFSATEIIKKQRSFSGYIRFALTSLVTLLPVGLTLLALVYGKDHVEKDTLPSVLFVGVVIAFLLFNLLAGWPMAQSLSSTLVSPIRVLRATRGHRGSLLFLGFATAGIGKSDFLPKITTASNVGEAVLIATGNALIGSLVIALTAAIAVTAWQFASQVDPTLDP